MQHTMKLRFVFSTIMFFMSHTASIAMFEDIESTILRRKDRFFYLKGVESVLAENYTKAHMCFSSASNDGNLDAVYNLGYLHQMGLGCPINYERAIEYYFYAAQKGHTKAQCNLGLIYENGLSGITDYKIAFNLYKSAAKKGSALAQFNLAMMYDRAAPSPENKNKILHYLNLSANQGNYMAHYYLAVMHSNNDEHEKALDHYTQATDNTNFSLENNNIHLYQDCILKNLTYLMELSIPVLQTSIQAAPLTHYINHHHLFEFQKLFKEFLPQTQISYQEASFSSPIEILKNTYPITENVAHSDSSTNHIWSASNIEDACIITFANNDSSPKRSIFHIPFSRQRTIKRLLHLDPQKSCADNAPSCHNFHVSIVTSFLSKHLFNVCNILRNMGYPPCIIYSRPIVLKTNRLNKSKKNPVKYHAYYSPELFTYDQQKKEIIPKDMAIQVEYPRNVLFDTASGEIATGVNVPLQ